MNNKIIKKLIAIKEPSIAQTINISSKKQVNRLLRYIETPEVVLLFEDYLKLYLEELNKSKTLNAQQTTIKNICLPITDRLTEDYQCLTLIKEPEFTKLKKTYKNPELLISQQKRTRIINLTRCMEIIKRLIEEINKGNSMCQLEQSQKDLYNLFLNELQEEAAYNPVDENKFIEDGKKARAIQSALRSKVKMEIDLDVLNEIFSNMKISNNGKNTVIKELKKNNPEFQYNLTKTKK